MTTARAAERTDDTSVARWSAAAAERIGPFRLGPGSPAASPQTAAIELPLARATSQLLREVAGGAIQETTVLFLAAVARMLQGHRPEQDPLVDVELDRARLPLALPDTSALPARDLVAQLDAALIAARNGAGALGALAPPLRERLSSDVLVGLGARAAADAHPRHALTLRLVLDTDPARLTADFDPARLATERAEAMLAACAEGLAALAEPDEAFAASPSETPAPPSAANLVTAFLETAAAHPDRPAVFVDDQACTYAELRAESERLAAHILRRIADPTGRFVAICLPKSLEAITAMLGTLLSGAAFAPLDPDLPRERVEAMLAALRPDALIIPIDRLLDFSWFAGVLIVHELVEAGEPGPLPPAPAADQAAYAIFTSGSTGRPKPVLVEHGAITHYAAWKRRYYRLEPATVTLQIAPLFFDSAMSDLFSTLTCGGALALVRPKAATDPAAFAQAVLAANATIFAIVPSLYGSLLDLLPDLPALRTVTVAGEKVHGALVRRHFARFPHVRLVNEYGPTEATVCATALTLSPEDGADDPSIGAPIEGVRLYLLDGRDRRAWDGTGEICIGGRGLARGYPGDPAATAEAFVPNPFHPAERLYRTGDLARIRSDGLLEFAGRKDGQVKVRGHRIELGEIEAVLLSHPDVQAAGAVARGEGPSARLLAFVVASGGRVPDGLMEHLGRRLPASMLPAEILPIAALPLTRNGKLDRAALPQATAAPVPYAGMRPIERRVAEIWATLLGRGIVDARANFFDMGGHSLIAIQLLSRLIAEFRVDLTLRDLFENAMLAEQAAMIETRQTRPQDVAAAIPPAPQADSYLLTPAQRELWLAEALGAAAGAHHIPERIVIEGPFEAGPFVDALDALVRRHEVFRMSFHEIDGEPRFRVAEHARIAVEHHDIAQAADPRVALSAIAAEAEARPFDMSRAPLARAVVVRQASDRHVLLLTLHHLVADAWSTGIVLRDLAELYAAAVAGRHPRLPDLPLRYRDYAAWRNGQAAGEEGARCRAHWQSVLATLRRAPLLPAPPASSESTPTGAKIRQLRLSRDVSAALHDLAREMGVLPFALPLSLLQAALHRVGGQRDLVVATVFSDRTRPELEDMAGPLLNILPVATRILPAMTFRELVDSVNGALLKAMEHQAVAPSAAVAREAEGEGVSPWEVMATFEAAGVEAAFEPFRRAGGVEIGDTPDLPAKFALAALFADDGETFELTCQYDAARVGEETIERLERHLIGFANRVSADPETPASLPPASLAGREVGEADDRTGVAERFERRASKNPHAPALLGPGALSYGALDRWANGVAQALHDRLAPQPETVCAILSERDAAVVVAALGVLKAGCAYLPIAADLPDRRIAALLKRAGCSCVLVADDRLAERVHRLGDAAVLDVRAAVPQGQPPSRCRPGQLCYIVFTSGSTGEPKGVAIEQRSLVNLCDWWTGAFDLNPRSRSAVCSSIGFDAFALECWPVLLSGGALRFYRDEEREPEALVRNLARDRITHAFLSTPLLDVLRTTEGLDCCSGVRLATGGDALILAAPLEAPVINLYGPTETTVVATCQPLTAGHPAGAAPIGRPIDGLRIHVIDDIGEVAPIGLVGEIAIGGVAVARGYVGDPAGTAAAFVPDPADPGKRMFRTGDLGQVGSDGSLRIFGRRDSQVKIRGHRVEPVEVEAALRAHPQVRQAAVIATGESGARALAAFVTMTGEASDPGDVLPWLGRRLPAYMLPKRIHVIDRLPLTPNGKLDREALAARIAGDLPVSRDAGGGEIPALVAGAWAQALGRGEVTDEDDFFALGGDSLAAMRVTAAVRRAMDVPIELRLLFDHPGLADYCAAVEERARSARGADALPPVRPIPWATGYPLTPGQETLLRQAGAARGLPLHAVFVPLRIAGTCSVAQVEAALRLLTRRHAALRSCFGRDAVARLAPDPPLIRALDLTQLEEEARIDEVTERLNAFRAEPVPIIGTVPVRWLVLALRPDLLIVALSTSHVVVDGQSIRNLSVQLQAALNGRTDDLPVADEPDFPAFAAWQSDRLANGGFDAQRCYWRAQLASLPDRAQEGGRASDLLGERSVIAQAWPAALKRAVADAARRHQCTPFMLLSAALASAIGEQTGVGRVPIGINVAHRPRGLEHAVGLFADTAILCLDGKGSDAAAGTLARARATVLDALLHGDLPFETVLADDREATGGDGRDLLRYMLLHHPAEPAPPGEPVMVDLLDLDRRAATGLPIAVQWVFAVREEETGYTASLNHASAGPDDSLAAALMSAWRAATERLTLVDAPEVAGGAITAPGSGPRSGPRGSPPARRRSWR